MLHDEDSEKKVPVAKKITFAIADSPLDVFANGVLSTK
jgi:hypothetical protein